MGHVVDLRLVLLATLAFAAASLTIGCSSGGGNGSSMTPPAAVAPAPTTMTVLLSSNANDQLTEFDLNVASLSLSNAAGKTVTLLARGTASEFVHVNAALVPLVSAKIPQDVYTAATAVVGSAAFTCVTLAPAGGLVTSIYAYGETPSSSVTVQLPEPVSVSGDSMAVALKLLVSQSASYSSCQGGLANSTYAITPTFTLTALPLPPQPTSPLGSVSSLDGQAAALNTGANGFQLVLPAYLGQAATTLQITTDGATVWQGLTDFSGLVAGGFVDLDGAIQADGSIHATRVAVQDVTAVDVQRGPLLFVDRSVAILDMDPRQAQGADARIDVETFNFATARFLISPQFTSLQSLPFAASFTAANMVPGQEVYISTPAFLDRGPYFAAATTITLMPQIINGTITGVTTSGNFTVYSVALADYDLFTNLATQAAQTTLLSNPSLMNVYADTNTQMLNTVAPAQGATLRFYGLVFNDGGTLRMDCAQMNDGVTGSSQTAPAVAQVAVARSAAGTVRVVRVPR